MRAACKGDLTAHIAISALSPNRKPQICPGAKAAPKAVRGRRSATPQVCPGAPAKVALLSVAYGPSLTSSLAPEKTRARSYGVGPQRRHPAVQPCGGSSTSSRALLQPEARHDGTSRWCDGSLVARRTFDDSRMSAGRRRAITEDANRGAVVGAGGGLDVVEGVEHMWGAYEGVGVALGCEIGV